MTAAAASICHEKGLSAMSAAVKAGGRLLEVSASRL